MAHLREHTCQVTPGRPSEEQGRFTHKVDCTNNVFHGTLGVSITAVPPTAVPITKHAWGFGPEGYPVPAADGGIGMAIKWRYVLGFLPLLLLIVGVVNMMLHSMSSGGWEK